MNRRNCKIFIGSKEWCSLPGLKTPLIKAKVDTGAKTSAVHAYDITPIRRSGVLWVKFLIHPLQRNDNLSYEVKAEVTDQRVVISSNGQKEKRYVITTDLSLGPLTYPIELTLSNRDPLRFRMLLGCEALIDRAIVDPGENCLLGSYSAQEAMAKYKGVKRAKKRENDER